jgi:hypothetical protein
VGALTPEEFSHVVLGAAAPADRIGDVVARLIGSHITIGPLVVGPGGIATATARGIRGQVSVTSCTDADWRHVATVPIALRVTVRLGKRTLRYRGAAQVQTRLRLRLESPCTVAVEVEDVQEHHIRTAVEPLGASARVIGWIGGVDDTVAEQVLSYVKDLMASADFDAAMHIDVIGLMQRAWDADLVVDLRGEGAS